MSCREGSGIGCFLLSFIRYSILYGAEAGFVTVSDLFTYNNDARGKSCPAKGFRDRRIP
ncbi:hypothetical protein BRYFOR_06444 [Marvinbryantia formatexigens DSM 14469]|uniref:Uncharacterized protein n=1 Tax=Marvinbryantia formatexigens DSM 14469 TaxID=478749 RepID=C6LCU6_9FIRM|nr:hypothetical protein BRYFOR_06444 [Marvinbryantia formatexigens DSM 14469]